MPKRKAKYEVTVRKVADRFNELGQFVPREFDGQSKSGKSIKWTNREEYLSAEYPRGLTPHLNPRINKKKSSKATLTYDGNAIYNSHVFSSPKSAKRYALKNNLIAFPGYEEPDKQPSKKRSWERTWTKKRHHE